MIGSSGISRIDKLQRGRGWKEVLECRRWSFGILGLALALAAAQGLQKVLDNRRWIFLGSCSVKNGKLAWMS